MLSINQTTIEYHRQENRLKQASDKLLKVQTIIISAIMAISLIAVSIFAIIHFI